MTRILTLEEDFHATNVENNGLAHAGVKCSATDSNWYHVQYGSNVVNGSDYDLGRCDRVSCHLSVLVKSTTRPPSLIVKNFLQGPSGLFDWHSFYNRKRIHSSLSYQTLLQVEITTIANQMAA